MDPVSSPPTTLQAASTALKQLSPLEAWYVARDAIKHEDDLTNHRLTWLLLLQGFLFAGMGATISGSAARGNFDGLFFWVALVIALVGLLSPLFVWIILDAAVSHIYLVTKWWKEEYDRPDPNAPAGSHLQMFPPVRGIKYDNHRFQLFEWLAKPIRLPLLLVFAWLGIIIVMVFSPATTGGTPQAKQREETITIPSADPTKPITIKRTERP